MIARLAEASQGNHWRLVLWLCALLWLALAVELWSEEHLGSALQLAPFVISLANLAATLLFLRQGGPRQRRLLGLLLLATTVIGFFGMYEHLHLSIDLELAIRPGARVGDVIGEALHGPYPLLAPGSLSFGAALTWLAAMGSMWESKQPGETP